ncbi:MAG: hypothetical protein ACXW3Z_06480 [Limisphaerales bacterium]
MSKAQKRFTIAAALICLGSSQMTGAGILDLMRGEPAQPEAQRVAFVGSANVRQVNGLAERLSGVDRWKKLEIGAQLHPGDVIRTKSGSVVLCMSESHSFVKVTPNTILRLVQIEKDWDRAAVSGEEERTGFVVRSCRGKAYFNPGDGSWRILEVNDVLARGTDVRTEAGAMVDLFHTGTKRPLRIPGSAQFTLNKEVLAQRVSLEPSLASVRR